MCRECHANYTVTQVFSEVNLLDWKSNFLVIYGFDKGSILYSTFFSSKTKSEMNSFLKELELEGLEKLTKLNLKISYPSNIRSDIRIDKPDNVYPRNISMLNVLEYSLIPDIVKIILSTPKNIKKLFHHS